LKWLISMPISATIISAERLLMSEMMPSRLMAARKGSTFALTSSSMRGNCRIEGIDLIQIQLKQGAVMLGDVTVQQDLELVDRGVDAPVSQRCRTWAWSSRRSRHRMPLLLQPLQPIRQ